VRSRDEMATKRPNRVEIEGRREVEVGNGMRRNSSAAAESTLHEVDVTHFIQTHHDGPITFVPPRPRNIREMVPQPGFEGGVSQRCQWACWVRLPGCGLLLVLGARLGCVDDSFRRG
jgi:hypothetical protein